MIELNSNRTDWFFFLSLSIFHFFAFLFCVTVKNDYLKQKIHSYYLLNIESAYVSCKPENLISFSFIFTRFFTGSGDGKSNKKAPYTIHLDRVSRENIFHFADVLFVWRIIKKRLFDVADKRKSSNKDWSYSVGALIDLHGNRFSFFTRKNFISKKLRKQDQNFIENIFKAFLKLPNKVPSFLSFSVKTTHKWKYL